MAAQRKARGKGPPERGNSNGVHHRCIMHMYWIAQKYRVTVRTESFKFKFVDFMVIKD